MREIKYRQPLFYNGHFRKFHYWGDIDGGFQSPVAGNLGRNSQEYTGLLDKNGKEIFVGDVVEWGHQRFGLVKSKIEFVAGSFQHYPNVGGVNSGVLNGIICSCEIIGNIYENPELIR